MEDKKSLVKENVESPKYLVVSAEDFEKNYNLNIASYIRYGEPDSSGSKKQGYYLNWAEASLLLKRYNSNLIVKVVESEKIDIGDDRWTIMLHLVLEDAVSGLQSPTYHYAVMAKDKMLSAKVCPTSRDINDSIQRGSVKTIAYFTGLGYRLYTGEGLNLDSSSKVSSLDHPLYLSLLNYSNLKERLVSLGLITSELEKTDFDFTSRVCDIRKVVDQMQVLYDEYEASRGSKKEPTLLNVAKPANVKDSSPLDPVKLFKSWSSLDEGLQWASEFLNISLEEVQLIYDAIEPVGGKKAYPFVCKVLDLKGV